MGQTLTLNAATRTVARQAVSDAALRAWQEDERRAEEADRKMAQENQRRAKAAAKGHLAHAFAQERADLRKQLASETARAEKYKADCELLRTQLGAASRKLHNLRRTATARGRRVDLLDAEVKVLRRRARSETARAERLERRVAGLLGAGRT